MARWRDKQPDDYRLPSDRDKLDEIRGRHMQPQGRSGEESENLYASMKGAARTSPNFRYFIIFSIFFLVLAGLNGFLIYGQQMESDNTIKSQRNRITALERRVKSQQREFHSRLAILSRQVISNRNEYKRQLRVIRADIDELRNEREGQNTNAQQNYRNVVKRLNRLENLLKN